MSMVLSEIAVVDAGAASAMRPPALWVAPEYTGSIAALEQKERELGERLAGIAGRFFRARFASSLAAEDMVLTHRSRHRHADRRKPRAEGGHPA